MKHIQHNFHGVLHSADLIEAELRKRLKPLGLQPRQARVLDAMNRLGPVSQSELASQFAVTSASMSTMTDRLMAAGFITREVHQESRRQNVLELTEQGYALLEGVMQAWTLVDDKIQSVLGHDADTFCNLGHSLRSGLGGTVPGQK